MQEEKAKDSEKQNQVGTRDWAEKMMSSAKKDEETIRGLMRPLPRGHPKKEKKKKKELSELTLLQISHRVKEPTRWKLVQEEDLVDTLL